MPIFTNKPPSAADLAMLRRNIEGIPPIEGRGSGGTPLEKLSPHQIHRLVELRKILQKVNVGASRVQGQFIFTLNILRELHAYVDTEKNLVQRVAYKSTLAKIREDLLLLQTHQEELNDMVKEGASEASIERVHDDLEDRGQAIAADFRNLVSKLQADTLNQRGLAASSLYRSSLANESRMYAKLDKEGGAMLRKWNDVRLEVMNLLATTNHDARAKAHLERMLRDLDEILRYLDEYAIIPWLAPREVIAAMVVIDRRLSDYQDEYNLAQSDSDRIANVIDDRATRDENRKKLGERTINFLNYIGLSRNLSLGGAVRFVRGVGRAVSATGRFVFRTLPTGFRSLATAVRTTPQRVLQTTKQVVRGVRGLGRVAGRGVGTVFGMRRRGRSRDGVISVDLDEGARKAGLESIVSRGYSRMNMPPGEQEPMEDMPEPTTSRSPVYDDSGRLTPEQEAEYDDAVSQTQRMPGSTSTSPSAMRGEDRTSMSNMIRERFDILESKLDLTNSNVSALLQDYHSTRSEAIHGSEIDGLRQQKEHDLLRSIVATLERVAGHMEDKKASKDKGSMLGSLIDRIMSMKNWMGGILKALGAWKLISGGVAMAKSLIATVARMGAPLLRLGGFVLRVLTGPIGALLGAGLAGWEIGKAIYGKFSTEILDFIDFAVSGVSKSIDWIKDKVEWVVGKLGMAKDAAVAGAKAVVDGAKGAVSSVRNARDNSIRRDMEREVKTYGGVTPETRDRADMAGVDTKSYPMFSRKTGKVTPAINPAGAPSTGQETDTPKSMDVGTPSTTRAAPTSSAPAVSAPSSSPQMATPSTSYSTPPMLRSPSNSSAVRPAPGTSGERAAGVEQKGTPVMSSGLYKVAPGSNMEGLRPEVLSNFDAMVAEYKQRGGKHPVNVNRAFASYEQQEALFKKYGPGRAARPGRSAHNFGVAIDIDRAAANEMAEMGLLDKYGFDRPVRGEPWHLQVKGVSAAMARQGIYSADHPNSQGGDPEATASATRGAPAGSQAPSVMARAQTDPTQPATKMVRETGTTPEKAVYDPRPKAAPTEKPEGQMVGARSSNAAMPAGHGAARIPEFSYADPTFFALNLGALSA